MYVVNVKYRESGNVFLVSEWDNLDFAEIICRRANETRDEREQNLFDYFVNESLTVRESRTESV